MSDPPLHIRTFIYPDDYEMVYDLWANAGPGIHLRRSDEPGELQKMLQRDPDLFLVAELDGRLVGAVLGGYDGRRGLVYHLAVAGEFRQRRIGAALMQALEARLRAKGCIRYYLLVTNDNDSAMRFYESQGWNRMDIQIYAKDLE